MVDFKDKRLEKVKVIVPLSTPLDDKGDFDSEGMKKLVGHCIGAGIDGFFVLGSCGEFPCFDYEESKQIIKETLSIIKRRVPSFVGVGRNSTKGTIKLAEIALNEGSDYLVVIPPFYFKNIPKKELIQHYETLNELGVPILIYNMPPYSVGLTKEFLEEASKLEKVVGIKESSGSLDFVGEVSMILPTYQGSDSKIFDSLERGAIGCVAGIGNIYPKLFVDLFKIYNSDKEGARKIQEEITRIKEVIYYSGPNAQVGIKIALENLGICSARMREPNGQATPESRNKIYSFMKELV